MVILGVIVIVNVILMLIMDVYFFHLDGQTRWRHHERVLENRREKLRVKSKEGKISVVKHLIAAGEQPPVARYLDAIARQYNVINKRLKPLLR